MTTNPLLPPAGAEPGSVWLLVHEKRSGIPSVWVWSDGSWVPSWGGGVSAQMMGNAGYRLSDPHGAAAAIAVLEGCGDNARCKMLMPRESLPYGVVIEWGNSGEERTVTAWGASFLEAAQIAMLHWPIC